jgi:hypothetical protein
MKSKIKNMKFNKIYSFLLLSVAIAGAGCEKKNDAEGTLSPITSVEEVRGLYKGADLTISKDQLMEATKITGTVISNTDSGNVKAGHVVIQQTLRSKTRGIILALNDAAAYKTGDSITVTIEGSKLSRVDGSLLLSGLSAGAVTKVTSGRKLLLTSTSSYEITQKPEAYESTLVKISSSTINPVPLPADKMAGNKSAVNGADSIMIHTESTASFAAASVPASASFIGIVVAGPQVAGKTTYQIWPRTGADITDRIAPVDPNGPKLGVFPVIISGYVSDSKGADGNNEYFQLLATRDIDFDKTPMALVTCTNAGSATPYPNAAPAGGWATGGGRTYKFNLTAGTVKKGEFFYVGGSGKKINGPNTTDISSAKWIRSIAYATNGGDGFGSATSGLLPNSGNAGGIAIFEGTNITETSVPVDVVFFGGTGKTTIFGDNGGYRIVNSDHYQVKDAATSTDQPFFFQGTNTYIIPHQTADLGIFVKLGGTYNVKTKTWDMVRGYNFYTMTASSTVSEIESNGVTTLTN